MKKLTAISIICTLLLMTGCTSTTESESAEVSSVTTTVSSSSTTVSEITKASEIATTVSEPTETSVLETILETSESISTTAAAPLEQEMPTPFLGDGDGDSNMLFYATVNLKLDYIDGNFIDSIGYDEFMEWLYSTTSSNGVYTSIDEAANLYSFIKYFNISDDVVRDRLIGLRDGSDDDFSNEEIDLILSDDAEAVAEYFVADNVIRKGENIYSLNWIYLHPTADYIENGITAEEIEEILPCYEEYWLAPDAEVALENKLSTYVNEPVELVINR